MLLLCALSAAGCSENESIEDATNKVHGQMAMPVHRIADAKSTDIEVALRDASLVFVGRLLSADFRSYPGSGVFVITASTRWTKLRILKGHDYHRTIEVFCITVGDDVPIERTVDGGYRLSPSYLLAGRDYVVVARKRRISGLPRDPLLYYIGGDGLGVWPATGENISELQARLAGGRP
jgi:hypothetical protein